MYFHRVDDSQETDVLFILFIIFKYPSIQFRLMGCWSLSQLTQGSGLDAKLWIYRDSTQKPANKHVLRV